MAAIAAATALMTCPGTALRGQELPDRGIALHDRQALARMLDATPPEAPVRDTAVMVFVGDVMLHKAQIMNAHERYGGEMDSSMHEAYDFSQYLSGISHRLREADIAVANMEFTLAGPPFTGYPSFSAPDSYAEYMAECGIDVFLTANNHICDKGDRGLERTLARYRELGKTHGIRTAGTYDTRCDTCQGILFVRARGIKVAIINFTYGTNAAMGKRYRACTGSPDTIRNLFRKAAEAGPELIIAMPHWGEEYRLLHSPEQERTAELLAENGADIIIGTHPHVVQDCDTISVSTGEGHRNVPVIYSLGNIVSNMSARDTQLGLMLTLRICRDEEGRAEILPPEYGFTWCSLPGRLTDSHATVPVKEYLHRKGEWLSAWDWIKMKDTYKRVRETTGIQD